MLKQSGILPGIQSGILRSGRLLFLGAMSFLLNSCYALQRPDLKRYAAYYYRPDASAQRLNLKAQPQLEVTYLGTSTLYFNDGQTGILIDGFFTRPENLLQIALGQVQTDKALVQDYLQRLNIEKLAALPVFHSHYDHALDSAEIARLTGAVMMGSESTAMIARGAALPERQIQIVEAGQAYHFGDFTLRFYPSKHVPLPGLVEATGMMGEITAPLRQPASIFDYREGETYAILIEHPLGKSLLHSGDFVPGEIAGVQADVLFLATPGFPKLAPELRAQFLDEVITNTGVKRVVPVHWDDFFRSLDRPMIALPRFAEDLDAAMDELITKSQNGEAFEIQFFPVWQKLPLFKSS